MSAASAAPAPWSPRAGMGVPCAAIVLAMLPAVLDQTMLATALPTIASDLGRLADVSWVVSAYVVAAAASTLPGSSSTGVLIAAVQNAVDRRQLGVAMATTSFFRALGGAFGAAALGAVFAAHLGGRLSPAGHLTALGPAARAQVVDAVQAVFIVAAPVAGVALGIVLLLKETPLAGPGGTAAGKRPRQTPTDAVPAANPESRRGSRETVGTTSTD